MDDLEETSVKKGGKKGKSDTDYHSKYRHAKKEIRELRQHLADTREKLEQLEKTVGEYGALLGTGHLADVVIVADDTEFPAHKMILSKRSPVFKAMFENELKEKQEARVVIPDLKKDVCEDMLRCLYTGKLANPEKNTLDLLQIADKYQFESLISYIKNNISAKTASDILLFAHLHDNSELKQQCTAYIKGHFSQVKETEEWQRMAKARPNLAIDFYFSKVESAWRQG